MDHKSSICRCRLSSKPGDKKEENGEMEIGRAGADYYPRRRWFGCANRVNWSSGTCNCLQDKKEKKVIRLIVLD